jgi:hypothetical protein
MYLITVTVECTVLDCTVLSEMRPYVQVGADAQPGACHVLKDFTVADTPRDSRSHACPRHYKGNLIIVKI